MKTNHPANSILVMEALWFDQVLGNLLLHTRLCYMGEMARIANPKAHYKSESKGGSRAHDTMLTIGVRSNVNYNVPGVNGTRCGLLLDTNHWSVVS
jgi:hypothetical protein